MIWSLILAHFLGDFFLQTDWMARKKNNFWVLCLHVGIHFAVMVVLAGGTRSVIWPYLLLIAVTHLGQDSLKIFLTNLKQQARVPFFLIDQLLHIVIIWGAVEWFHVNHGPLPLFDKPVWAIIALAFLLVTNVWFITERIIFFENIEYKKNIDQTKYARMLSRAGLTSLFFLLRLWVFPGLILFLSAPYPRSEHRQRALLTDFSVSVFGMLFLLLALG